MSVERVTDDWTEEQKRRFCAKWDELLALRDERVPLDLHHDMREAAYELGLLDRPYMRVHITIGGKRYRAALFEQQGDTLSGAMSIEFEGRCYHGTLFAEDEIAKEYEE